MLFFTPFNLSNYRFIGYKITVTKSHSKMQTLKGRRLKCEMV